MYNLIIKNGTVIDGTGGEMYHSDIGVIGDKIAKIGDLHGEQAKMEVNASGKFVSPGFIDVNSHSDTYWQIFLSPGQESLLYQGVTTIIGGNCGSSLAPLTSPKNIETIQKWADIKQVNVNWLKMSEFLNFLEKKKIPVNFGTLTGHGTLRRGIVGDETRNLNPKEMSYCKKELKESLLEGSLGMSTGLIYSHARAASYEEISELAGIVKEKNGVYATHIRGEGAEIIESVEEALKVAQSCGVKLHISHLKVTGEKNWHKMKEAVAMIEQAKENGVEVSFDVYPYTSTGSVLYALLPAWVSEGGKKMMLSRLRNEGTRKKIIAEMRKSDRDWSKAEISISPLNRTLTRRKITEIAKSQDKSIEDAVVDLLIACEGRIITNMEVLSEENIRAAVRHPLSFISSNGAGYSVNHKISGEIVHPRSFGTFSKFFSQYVKNGQLLGWEEAVKKVTGGPAEKFGLKGRGILKEGNFGDIVVFDKDKIDGPASRENPYQYSKGFDCVFINGQAAVFEGQITGMKSGAILRK